MLYNNRRSVEDMTPIPKEESPVTPSVMVREENPDKCCKDKCCKDKCCKDKCCKVMKEDVHIACKCCAYSWCFTLNGIECCCVSMSKCCISLSGLALCCNKFLEEIDCDTH